MDIQQQGQTMLEPKNNKTMLSVIIAVVIIIIIGFGLWYMKSKGPATSNTTGDQTAVKVKTVANKGDIVSMNYTGKLVDGTVFDSNIDPKFKHVQPFTFTLGVGQVIAGWDEGIVGMKVGEKKTMTIPAEKAYGARGQGPIPPNSTLMFDVELVSVK